MAATATALLQATRDLLAEPGAWGQGLYAQNRLGAPVTSKSAFACRWCLWGAFSCVTHTADQGPGWIGGIEILERLTGGDIEEWNDWEGRTHAEVLALLDEAITLAQAGEAGTGETREAGLDAQRDHAVAEGDAP